MLDQFGPHGAIRLSLCMIVKNEEATLPRCLASVGAVDEIVVVDTGSRDRTVELAKAAGAIVKHFDWIDDFAAARNVALAAASGDWILVLDADEELTSGGIAQLRQEAKGPHGAYVFSLDSVIGEGGQTRTYTSQVLRFFRNHPGIRYRGRVHEQVSSAIADLEFSTGHSAVRILHSGYLPSLMADQEKYRRNVRLLEIMAEESPGDPYVWYQLGKTHLGGKDAVLAKDALATAAELLAERSDSGQFPFLPKVYLLLAELAQRSNLDDQAAQVIENGLRRHPDFPELWLAGARASIAAGNLDSAVDRFDQCLSLAQSRVGYAIDYSEVSAAAAMESGEILLAWNRTAEAVKRFELAAVSTGTRRVEPWLRLAKAHLSLGQHAQATTAYERSALISPDQFPIQLALGTLYFEQRRYAKALEALEAADRLQPGVKDIGFLIQQCRQLLHAGG